MLYAVVFLIFPYILMLSPLWVSCFFQRSSPSVNAHTAASECRASGGGEPAGRAKQRIHSSLNLAIWQRFHFVKKSAHLFRRLCERDLRPLLNVCVAAGVVVHLDAASAGKLVQLCCPVPGCGGTLGLLDHFLLAQENTWDVVPGDAVHRLGTHCLACLLGWSNSLRSLGCALGDFSTLVSICWCFTEALKDYRGATAVRVLIGTKKEKT